MKVRLRMFNVHTSIRVYDTENMIDAKTIEHYKSEFGSENVVMIEVEENDKY